MKRKDFSINSDSVWKYYEVNESQPLDWRIGNLHIWCAKDGLELKIAHRYDSGGEGKNELETAMLSWQRWALRQKNPKVQLLPAMPDMPLMVKPENKLHIAEDASTRIYVKVPVWVRLVLESSQDTVLLELPSVPLSKTWFGSYVDGELCYWLSSGARREALPDPEHRNSAICPILLIDKSPEDLDVEKICLRTENMTIFDDGVQLWTDETRIIFKGMTEVSQIEVTGKAPDESPKAVMISSPREVQRKSISAKTFSSLKELPGLGFLTR